MAEFNLKSTHVSCLYYLYKYGSLTSKDLCDICDEDKANISRSIKFLETGGYLTCASKAKKRYLSLVELTEEGKNIGKHIAEKVDRVLISASEGLSEKDRVIFYRALALINQNLQNISDKIDK